MFPEDYDMKGSRFYTRRVRVYLGDSPVQTNTIKNDLDESCHSVGLGGEGCVN